MNVLAQWIPSWSETSPEALARRERSLNEEIADLERKAEQARIERDRVRAERREWK
jgi:hypothetical protein